MEHNPNGISESEFIDVLGNEDDFVQVLGVTPPDGSEIEVTSVELDDGESFLIDIDEDIPSEEADVLVTDEEYAEDSSDLISD